MKKIILVLFGLWMALSLSAQSSLRNSVAIVFNQPAKEDVQTILDYSIWLSRIGQYQASRDLNRLTREGFGSGVVIESEGQILLLTNSHVVGIGKRANVCFVNNGDSLFLSDCPCMYQDEHLDIAILRLPVSEQVTQVVKPLSLSPSEYEDGTTVYSAGYPGLGNTPSWQYGKGIISNAQLRLPDTDHTYIQHTAQIDKGSSGSPLLVQTAEGYEMIGINTLKATQREAVGIAIPVETIKQAIAQCQATSTIEPMHGLDTLSVKQYAILYQQVPDSVIDEQKKLFAEGYLLEGLALVPAYIRDHAPEKAHKGRTREVSRYANKGAGHQTADRTKDDKGIDTDFPYRNAIYLGVCSWSPFRAFYQVGLGYERYFITYLRTGMDIAYFAMPDGYVGETTPKGMHLGVHVGGQLPIMVGRFDLIPYITPDVGFNFNFKGEDGHSIIHYGGGVGMEFAYPMKRSMVMIGVEYNLQWFHPFNTQSSATKAGHGFGVHLGIAF